MNIGTVSEEWLLHFNPVVGGQHDHPDHDRRRARELGLLRGDREADVRRGASFCIQQAERPDHLRDAPGGVNYLTASRRSTRGKIVFAETLRALPFQQAAGVAVEGPEPKAARAALSQLLEPLLGVDPHAGRSRRRCAQSCWSQLLEGQLSFDRPAHTGDAASYQRLQPACDQRDRR